MEQLKSVRALMAEHHVDALIVPGTDPHSSEYLAEYWKEREFISAFSGSAGTAVITLDGGCLWTDSRYFLQAAQQLKQSGLLLQKEGEIGTPTIEEWLCNTLKKGQVVAINPEMISVNGFNTLQEKLQEGGLNIYTKFDFIKAVWKNRPEMPKSPVIEFGEEHSGENTNSKLIRLREQLTKNKANTMLITALDEIAWLFNIRGGDIDYNPVNISFALVSPTKATLFIAEEKVSDKVKKYLNSFGVETAPYDGIYNALATLSSETIIAIDPNKCNYALKLAIPQNIQIKEIPSPITNMKCIKNETELQGVSRAMIKDGVALVKFWMWLEEQIEKKETVTELDVIDKLHDFRAEQEGFITESFNTIAGYGEHGAIVHYAADKESNATLKPESFLLLDSGGQYYDGTTDITRTVALGKVTQDMKFDYTMVLKGHLALGYQLFPYGTRGAQLDAIARQFLWNSEMQYGHGTGHGVGHCLTVHEGPQSIRMNENPTILEKGMIISNEPGVYRAGKHGIRIENLVVVSDYANNENEFGKFMRFKTLTLFPYDNKSIEVGLLNPDELLQINTYHQIVYKTLSPYLNTKEAAWLKSKTTQL